MVETLICEIKTFQNRYNTPLTASGAAPQRRGRRRRRAHPRHAAARRAARVPLAGPRARAPPQGAAPVQQPLPAHAAGQGQRAAGQLTTLNLYFILLHKSTLFLYLQMLLSKLGSDASSESSTRDSKSPATQRTRLPVPRENLSHPGKKILYYIFKRLTS